MANNSEEGKLIGEVVHFFSKIKVGVIRLSDSLAAGDEIRIIGGEETDFKQKVGSMEVDHQKIEKAKKGDEVGLKLKKRAREGYKVYKL